MELLLSLLVAVIVIGVVYYVVTLLPLPAPFDVIAEAIVVIAALVYIFQYII